MVGLSVWYEIEFDRKINASLNSQRPSVCIFTGQAYLWSVRAQTMVAGGKVNCLLLFLIADFKKRVSLR